LGISDHGNVFGHIDHWSQCKKAGIKPILGTELYVTHQSAAIKTQENRGNSHMVAWAKNKEGWLNLLKLVSKTNDPDYYYYRPRISLFNWTDSNSNQEHFGLEHFIGPDKGIMSFSGHQGSHLSDNLFCDLFGEPTKRSEDLKRAYGQYKERDIEFYRKFLRKEWLQSTCELALRMEKMFGKGNFFIELQNELNPNDKLALWIHPLICECLRTVSKETGIPALASSDPHYSAPEDAADQRLMVSVNMKETEASIQEKLDSDEGHDIMVFFGSNNFFIHSYEEMKEKFTQEELDMTNKVAEQVEVFDIQEKPYIPEFKIPETFDRDLPYLSSVEKDSDKYLMYLCVEGAKRLQPWKVSGISKDKYWERLKEETNVIFNVGLSDYFLVVYDICMAADNRPADHSFDWEFNLKNGGDLDPIPRGVGRGSAAGCLTSYLIGITDIDSLKYSLLFARFFNAGRCTKDHISYPDVDLDFAVMGRDWVLEYIKHKYGHSNVAQIMTFQTMKGRAAIKDIFRVKDVVGGFELANKICEFIPDEAEIADEIQQMKDSGEDDYNITKWALDNSDQIQEYYTDPVLKEVFDQALRCEGIKRSQGKHPSGVIITPKPIEEYFPMALDTKTKEKIIAFDMRDAEKRGGTKFDILGVTILDKLKKAQDLYNARTK
jgi:DNA polymerase-3 subunit alpha